MPALHSAAAVRAGSRRRWITGAVIAATLLAEVPRVADPASPAAPVMACDGPDIHVADARCARLSRCPRTAATAPAGAPPPGAGLRNASASGPAGASHRSALRHVIGL